jgi:hypothetical protein
MREALIILTVAAVLIVLTAIKYRRQIMALIGFYRQLKTIRAGMREPGGRARINDPVDGIQLVKCGRCGKWLPESETTRLSTGSVCTVDCRSVVAS